MFRRNKDTYISYLIGNRSPRTLADWLQKEGLADAVDAGADSTVNHNDGFFRYYRLSFRQRKCAARPGSGYFSYLSLPRHQGIQRHYFDEIAHVLNASCLADRYDPSAIGARLGTK
ncbi:hypothetical protein [Sodalis-like endosymbiont of Proechinophthirus fluctus]|uniref:hypothetical protein n=1 Tax=Sodalis-like endosymbiont of Proechinophthirus fluctus TaxID=1462730 RepID=UPI001650ACAF|nr:hypothetical protein [Sodalis-like endosymbiont of Proechinophthirus fluctus]